MRSIQSVDVAGEGEPLEPVFGQPKLGHPLWVAPGLEHVVVQLVTLDVLGDLGLELARHILAFETEPHRMVEDRGHGCVDAFDRLVPVGVERRAGREPDLDLGWIATGLRGARRDPLDRVGDHLGQQAGAGDHAIKEPATEMQGLRPFGTEGDRDALAHRLADASGHAVADRHRCPRRSRSDPARR